MKLEIDSKAYEDLRKHLFSGEVEQVAFGYARLSSLHSDEVCHILEFEFLSAGEFIFQSSYHIEVHPEVLARVIKKSFDMDACVVEFHSHRSSLPARFSMTDMSGFNEVVPHVLWRLRDKPYMAIVLHETSFDGLLWKPGDTDPGQLDGIRVDQTLLSPTALTLNKKSI